MSRYRVFVFVAATLSAALWAYACGDGTTEPPTPPPDPPRPTTVTVSPATAELALLGATVQLRAEVRDQNGQVMAGASVTWASSAPAVATVSASGLVTAAGNGTATITATAGGVSGTATVTVTATNPDRAALVALYNATNGPNWANSENWLTDAPLWGWYGVETNASGRVVAIVLRGRWDTEARRWLEHGLHGTIPPDVGSLSELRTLDLAHNYLTGKIPRKISGLTKLTALDVGTNELEGTIPPGLAGLSSLEWLNLSENRLNGPIPSELGRLAQLRSLHLGSNELTGPIPPELGDLVSLEYLVIENNGRVAGTIPPQLANLSNLQTMVLQGNSLTGPIPPELGNLADVHSLAFLGGNQLVGPLPRSFLRLDLLTAVGFQENAGLCVPGDGDFVTWMRTISDFEGSLCNASDIAVLRSLHDATSGTDWTNSSGWMGDGAVSEWHGVSSDSLGRVTGLDLADNQLAGQLPASLGALARLTRLRIGGNALSGRLPLSLTQLSLREFHYADTDLCIPTEASFRAWLDGIASRKGTGTGCSALSDREILQALFEATRGAAWHRSENWLTDAPLGRWYGVEVDGLGQVSRLRLRENNLTGILPPEIGGLSNLRGLILARIGNRPGTNTPRP